MDKVFLNIRVPRELKRQFSWVCRKQSQTMTSQLNFMIRRHLRENEIDGISHQSGMNSNLNISQISANPDPFVSSIENEASSNNWQGF